MKLYFCTEKTPGLGRKDICQLREHCHLEEWLRSPLLLGVHPRPPSSLNGQRGLSRERPLNQDSQALCPLQVWSTRGPSPISCKASGGGKRHGRVVGMHVMGWTSDLTSKHGTHGKGMEERDTWQGRHYKQKSVFGCWDTYHHNIPNSKTACIRTKKQQI